jgi:hypothetical protein
VLLAFLKSENKRFFRPAYYSTQEGFLVFMSHLKSISHSSDRGHGLRPYIQYYHDINIDILYILSVLLWECPNNKAPKGRIVSSQSTSTYAPDLKVSFPNKYWFPALGNSTLCHASHRRAIEEQLNLGDAGLSGKNKHHARAPGQALETGYKVLTSPKLFRPNFAHRADFIRSALAG